MRIAQLAYITLFLTIQPALCQNHRIIDSLLNQLEIVKVDTQKAKILSDLGWEYNQGEPEKSKQVSLALLQFSEKIDYDWGRGAAYLNLAYYYDYQGDYQKALEYHLKNVEIQKKSHRPRRIASGYFNLGNIFQRIEEYDLAIISYSKAAKIIDSLKIGNYQGDLGKLYMNIGVAYKDKEAVDSSLKYLLIAKEYSAGSTDSSWLTDLYTNIGMALEQFPQRYEEALYNYELALDIAQKINFQRNYPLIYGGLADLYYAMGKYDLAINNALKEVEYAKVSGPERNILYGYHILIKSHKKKQDFKSLSEFQEKYIFIKDSLFSIDKQNEISKLKVEFETEEKERNIVLLISEQATLKAKNEKRQLWFVIIGISSGVLFIVLVFVVILSVLHNRHQRKIKEIELIKTKAEFEQKVLRAQMNPHFIFNSLNSIQHYILSNQTQYAYDYLARFSALIRQVLVNSEHSAISLAKEIELLEIYIELEQRRFQNRFSYEITYDKSLPLEQVEVPVMLIQPFVENAIWHGIMNMDKDKKGQLKVSFVFDQEVLKICVEDNGIGRKAAEKLKKNDEYDSVGMLFSQKRLEIMKLVSGKNSKIMVTDLYNEDGIAKGTKVDIILPV